MAKPGNKSPSVAIIPYLCKDSLSYIALVNYSFLPVFFTSAILLSYFLLNYCIYL